MYPPVFETLKNNTDVVALLGSNPLRVYVPGEADQDTVRPYLTWQIVSGLPENVLDKVPDIDSHTVQMDAYARTLSEARAVVKAVRNAIEIFAYITGWLGESKEVDTRLYRVSFQVDWFTQRNSN